MFGLFQVAKVYFSLTASAGFFFGVESLARIFLEGGGGVEFSNAPILMLTAFHNSAVWSYSRISTEKLIQSFFNCRSLFRNVKGILIIILALWLRKFSSLGHDTIKSRCLDTKKKFLLWPRCHLSENNFHKNWSLNPVRVLDVCSEMRNDSKKCFTFVVTNSLGLGIL